MVFCFFQKILEKNEHLKFNEVPIDIEFISILVERKLDYDWISNLEQISMDFMSFCHTHKLVFIRLPFFCQIVNIDTKKYLSFVTSNNNKNQYSNCAQPVNHMTFEIQKWHGRKSFIMANELSIFFRGQEKHCPNFRK